MARVDVPGLERAVGVMDRPKVVVVHETDGRKYLEALVELHHGDDIATLEFVEATVLRKFIRGLLREKQPFLKVLARAGRNAMFRLGIPWLRNKTIIVGVAPWDFRFLLHQSLRRGNRFIYHTSWPFWDGSFVPRKYGPLTPILRRLWLRAMRSSSVEVVAVTSAAADGVAAVVPGKRATIIPHVVSAAFFSGQARAATYSFNLIYVGELITQKGIKVFPALLDELKDISVHLHIVGAGPLESFVASELASRPNVTVHGRITDRNTLARLFFDSHLLVLPSVRTTRWEELFGMVIIEAMAAGLPTIASDHIGPRSVIKHGVDGLLVAEGDLDHIATSIRSLAGNIDYWKRLSNAAFSAGRAYSITNIQALWLQLLCFPPNSRLTK